MTDPVHMETGIRFSGIFRFGVFEFDSVGLELRRSGHFIRLQQQPLQLLQVLLDNAGNPVSREDLRIKLWPGELVVDFDRNLNKAMNKLRHALGDTADNPRFIQTVHRVGYRFIAPVQRLCQEVPQLADTAEPLLAVEIPGDPTVEESMSPVATHFEETSRLNFVGWRWLLAFAAAVIAVFGASELIPRWHQRAARAAEVPVQPLRRSLAIVGFRNLSDRPDEAWLDAALSDWLTVDLASTGQLRTITSERVEGVKKELHVAHADGMDPEVVKKMGTLLDTDYLVVGDYGLVGDAPNRSIRLDIRLEDVHSGEQIALFSETGVETNLFGLVAGADEQLRDRFQIARLTQNQETAVAMSMPGSPQAARLYSQALLALRQMDGRTASQLLDKCIAMEPKRAASHVAMARAWEQLGYDKRAQEEAKTALMLAGGLPRAEHLRVEGRYANLSKDWKRAIEVYRALVEFFPDSVDDGLELAGAQIRAGEGRSALSTIAALKRLPLPMGNDPLLDRAEAGALQSQGDFRGALAAEQRGADKAMAQGATLLYAQFLADESWALVNLGQPQQSRAVAEQSLTLFMHGDDPRGVALDTGILGIASLNEGDAAGAKADFEKALQMRQSQGSVMSTAAGYDDLGDAQVALGDLEGARLNYQRALAVYQEIGHEEGIAVVKDSLGSLSLARGDLPQAMRYLNDAVTVAGHIGDRGKTAEALSDLGDALRLRGELDRSQRLQEQALVSFEALGRRTGAAHVHLALAKLWLDRSLPQRAVRESGLASAEYAAEHSFGDKALADAVRARALLVDGDEAGAGRALTDAQQAMEHSDRVEAKLAVELAAWFCRSHSHRKPEKTVIRGEFEQIVVAAKARGFLTFVSEANRELTGMERSLVPRRS